MRKEQNINEEDIPRLLAKDLRQHSKQFVEYYWLFVKKLAYQLTRSDEEAEDIRQEVFTCVLLALEHKSALDIEGIKFRGYLRRAIHNRYINSFRGKHRCDESLDTPALQETLVDGNTPELTFENKELQDKIIELLNNLSQEQHDALVLKYGWKMHYPDIARFLQISKGKAIRLVRQGKKKLKELISAEDYDNCFK